MSKPRHGPLQRTLAVLKSPLTSELGAESGKAYGVHGTDCSHKVKLELICRAMEML